MSLSAHDFVAIYQATSKNMFSRYSSIDNHISSYSMGKMDAGGTCFFISASSTARHNRLPVAEDTISLTFDSEHLHVRVLLRQIVPPQQTLIIPTHIHQVPTNYKPIINITTVDVGGREWTVYAAGYEMVIKTDEESAEHDLLMLSLCRSDVI